MNELEFSFGQSPWEAALETLDRGSGLSGARFLTLMEGESETALEDALERIEQRDILLDVQDLPSAAAGEAAVRLRREAQLVREGTLLTALEEHDPLRLYLEELAAIPAFGDAQLLAQECAGGREAAREQLLNLCLSRVVELAGELAGRGVLLLDLIQEGSLALWQAIGDYEGGDFQTFSDRRIRQAMARLVICQARNNGVGQKLRQALEDYRSVDERLLGELGRNATLEEIALELHISAEETGRIKGMLDSARLVDQARAEQEPPEESEEDEQHVEDTALFQTRRRILELLSCLEEEDARLLTLRFGLEGGRPLSPEQTGSRLGLTPEEVVAREAAALAKLRHSGIQQ